MTGNITDAYPLTPQQRGMLYDVLSHPNSSIYYGCVTFDIEGKLDVPRFISAWYSTTNRYSTLRTQFVWEGVEQPLQVVHDTVEIPWSLEDCTNDDELNKSQNIARLRSRYRLQQVDFDKAPLMSLKIVKYSENRYTIIWLIHHLIMDQWSSSVVLNSVVNAYTENGDEQNHEVNSEITYGDYVRYLHERDNSKSSVYWEQYLNGFTASRLKLVEPTLSSVTALREQNSIKYDSNAHITKPLHQCVEQAYSLDKSSSIREFCARNSVTLAGFIHGIWAIIVAAYSGTDKPVLGSVLSGRYSAISGIENAVGLFINTLPVAVEIDNKTSVVDWLIQIQSRIVNNQQHEQADLQNLKSQLNVHDSLVYDSVVTIVPEFVFDDLETADSTLRFSNFNYVVDSVVPLTLTADPKPEIRLSLHFDPSKFTSASIVQMHKDFAYLSSAILTAADKSSSELLKSLRHRYLFDMETVTPVAVPTPKYRHTADWFNQTLAKYPARTAICSTNQSLNYRSLSTMAYGIAKNVSAVIENSFSELEKNQFDNSGNSHTVGIVVTEVWKQVVAMLGAHLSDVAYIPMDPNAPPERISQLIESSNCQCIICDGVTEAIFNNIDITLINVDNALVSESNRNLEVKYGASVTGQTTISNTQNRCHTAYVMFTSGSTGTPKGVMVSHQNLIYSTQSRIDYYENESPRFIMLSPTTFDSSVVGIYWSLLGGGYLLVPERDEVKDIQLIAQLIEQHQIDTVLCLTSYYDLLLEGSGKTQLQSLTRVILAGEECTSSIVSKHYNAIPHAQLYNEYGPTECTVWSSVAKLEKKQTEITIGRSIPGSSVHIVDETGNPLPPGTLGEIMITGPGVADGYLNNPEETAKRFVYNPSGLFSDNPYHSYCTGDLGSLSADHQVIFHGRADRQIKIRGHRIEPAELETVAMTVSGVDTCIAIGLATAKTKKQSIDTQLSSQQTRQPKRYSQIAVYITSSFNSNLTETSVDETNATQTRFITLCENVLTSIKEILPDYMHPSFVALIDAFPQTSSGKVDVGAIDEVSVIARSSERTVQQIENYFDTEPVADGSDVILDSLFDLAAEVLNTSKVYPNDTFFELGGDSISAIMFVSRARERGLQCDIKQLADQKSFAVIAQELLSANQSSTDQSDQISPYGKTPLTPIQQWYFSLQNPHPEQWNIAYHVLLKNETATTNLSRSINNVLQENHAIGSQFFQNNIIWQCQIPNEVPSDGLIITLNNQSNTDADSLIDKTIREHSLSWRLEDGWLIRFVLLENKPGITKDLYIVSHHLVLDHISISLLVRQIVLATGNQALKHDKTQAKTISFRQYAHDLDESNIAECSDWILNRAQIKNPAKNLLTEANSHHYLKSLNENDTLTLLSVTNTADVNLLEVLITVLTIVFNRCVEVRSYSEAHISSNIDFYVESSGRDSTEDSLNVTDVIGWLTHFYPVDTHALNNTDMIEVLKNVKNHLRKNKSINSDYLNWFYQHSSGSPTQTSDNISCLVNYLGHSNALSSDDNYSISAYNKDFLRDQGAKRAFDIELNAYIDRNELTLDWHVVSAVDSNQIRSITSSVMDSIVTLTSTIQQSGEGHVYTPSDFSSVSMSQDELDKMINDIGQN